MTEVHALASLLVLGLAAPAQDVISVNFQGAGGRPVTGIAGAVPRGGWNNVEGGSRGEPLPIRTDDAQDLGARLVFVSASAGQRWDLSAGSENAALFDGQIVASAMDGEAAVTVTGVPYTRYDVLVYVGHGPTARGREARLSAGARSVVYANEDLSAYGEPIGFRMTSAAAPPIVAANTVALRDCMDGGFTLVLEPAPGSLLSGASGIAGFQIVNVGQDTDADGLEDGWERSWFGNLEATAAGDADSDSLRNGDEQRQRSSPVIADTDGDGLGDAQEASRETDPTRADTDGDGLLDGVETMTGVFAGSTDTGTHPRQTDSDGDRARDGAEVRRGTDPNLTASRPPMPNVIVILADDLGWGELGAYGNRQIRTPNLDRLAGEGVRFTQFYANHICAPSRCTLLTGRHTGHAQVRTNVKPPLRAGTRTLAHLLADQGYTTACIGKWGFGEAMTTGHPQHQGFGEFFGFLDQYHCHWYYPAFLWRNDQQVFYPRNNGVWGPGNTGQDHAHDELTREALGFVERNRSNPFFLLLTWTLPHVSLQEPPHSDPVRRALGETAIEEFYGDVNWREPNANFPSDYYTSHARPRRAYAAMISALDRDVGRLRTRLEQLGIDRDTLILFTSDNGATDCCGVDAAFFESHGGLRGSKGEMYEGSLRVPCIAWSPGRVVPGQVSDHVAAIWDVLPTVAELVEAEVPDDCDGVSFLPTLLGRPECQATHEFLYWEYEQGGLRKAVRWGNWKGVRYGFAGRAPIELYNLATDPREMRDVAAQWPQVVAQIDRLMAAGHVPSERSIFYRAEDEFPIRHDVFIGQAPPGFALVSDPDEAGVVLSPLAHDLTTPLSVDTWWQVSGFARGANAALLLGDGANPAAHVRFGVDARRRELFIAQGATRLSTPMPATENPLRPFALTARLDPVTGAVELREGERTWVTGTLPAPPGRITHYGHEVIDAIAVFAAIDPPPSRLRPRGAYTVFGTGCLGSAGRPGLSLLSEPPALGQCLTLRVGGLPQQPGAPLSGVLGASTSMWGTVPLPLALDGMGMPGCRLYVSPDVLVPLANAGGSAVWSTWIPAESSLLGGALHQQVLIVDPAANPAGLTASNAGSGSIGAR